MAKDWGREANPCKTCTRTKYPRTCDNKCPDWTAWFLRSWEKLREIFRDYIQEDEDG